MSTKKQISFLDFLELILIKKKFLFTFFFISVIITYLSIFFFVEEKFDSSSTILPANEQQMPGIASMLGDLSGLPLGLGGFSSTEMSMFNTIIYSRTTLENVINKFNLIEIYDLSLDDPKYLERALERLTDEITTKETEDNAYQIKVRATSPILSAEINNYIIELLNNRILELRQTSSKENRIFLSERVDEIKTNLKEAEDSLRVFQEETKFYEATSQISSIIDAYSEFDKNLINTEIEKLTLENLLPSESPKLKNINQSYKELNRKVTQLKSKGLDNSFFPPLSDIPNLALEYFRLFREIEINSSLLQFILPLFEQAKIEEKKDLAVIQIIDFAVPPVEKSYPPRLVLTLLINFLIFLVLLTYISISYRTNDTEKARIKKLVGSIFKWQ